ncbi:uncharacterized protein LOC109975355 [Xyrichtys novacula]|uniref:Uncharacterized protein LOC109975355 n=1 Tax=Xyrichtys novacula TaxID=13765 RepID=A0AAV1EYQ6_XYRNO|nr:uncharacterized protein LOC109975355 [Xyrichtys novacula]
MTARLWTAATCFVTISVWKTVLALSLLVGVGVSLPLGTDEIKYLTVSTGETVTLPAGSAELQGDYSVLWSLKNGNEEVKLVTCDAGEPPEYFKENLDLDTTYGSLTFGPLRVEDSGVCEGEITDGDNSVHRYKYKITVSEARANASTMRFDLTIVLAVVFLVLLL